MLRTDDVADSLVVEVVGEGVGVDVEAVVRREEVGSVTGTGEIRQLNSQQ